MGTHAMTASVRGEETGMRELAARSRAVASIALAAGATVALTAGAAATAPATAATPRTAVIGPPHEIFIDPTPVDIVPNTQQTITVTVWDARAPGPVVDSPITLCITGPATLASGGTTTTLSTSSRGTVTTALQAGSTLGSGTVTASEPNSGESGCSGGTAQARLQYTVGEIGSIKLVPDATASVGRAAKVGAYVTMADGSRAANVSVSFTVTGANPATGTVPANVMGEAGFYYTPASAGTDHVTATVGGVTGADTVVVGPRIKPGQHPWLGAVSRSRGTVNVAVQTHPLVAARKVKIYYVHKVRGHKATLRYLGYALTAADGRAHARLRGLVPGRAYPLKARMAGADYVEHLSSARTLTIE